MVKALRSCLEAVKGRIKAGHLLPQDRSPVLPLPSHYGNDWGSSRHGNPDRGRVESSPWAYGQGKGRKRGWESSCHGYGILPCRLNSFTLGNPGSSLSQDFLGTLKIFAAYIISQAIGFAMGYGILRGWESSCHGLRYPPL